MKKYYITIILLSILFFYEYYIIYTYQIIYNQYYMLNIDEWNCVNKREEPRKYFRKADHLYECKNFIRIKGNI